MSLQIALQNQTSSNQVYAYITGLAIDNGNRVFLLQSDGQTPYYPSSPSSTVQPLQANCAISLGAPGNTVYATVPHLAGARLWFSVGNTLDFYLNPGPGLVEPSSANPSDSNYNKNWAFCEFTFNSSQLYANISYVDFVSIPIALTLTNQSNQTKHVAGLPANGFQTIASQLQAQSQSDGQPWGSMNYNNLRILSPNSYIGQNSGAFNGYYDNYVNQCWNQYSGNDLTVETQTGWGNVTARMANNTLNFSDGSSFGKPSAADIFSNSTGPFAGGANVSGEQLNIGARLAAALNRSTLLSSNSQPDGPNASQYYQTSPTNHYARILHATNLDGRGYAFPYDDVTPDNGPDQSGYLNDGAPSLWTIAVGGNNATASLEEASQRNMALLTEAKTMATLSVPEQLEKLKQNAAYEEPAPAQEEDHAPETNKGLEVVAPVPAVEEPAPPANKSQDPKKKNVIAKFLGVLKKLAAKLKPSA